MGKKGKRSKRKTANAADRASIYDLQTQLDELNEKFSKSKDLNLFSQAANELREGIQLIEATILESNETLHKMNLHAWFFKSKLIFYANLIFIEFTRRNFDDAIQIYKKHFERRNIDMNKKILSRDFSSLQLRYHEALLRQGKGSVDTFISLSKVRITHSMKHDDNALVSDLIRSTNILRTIKHFDVAVLLGKQLEKLTGDTVSLATTYLEQYLVEYYPKFGRNIDSPPENLDLFRNMGTLLASMFQKYNNGGFDTSVYPGPLLVLAQSIYLLHQCSSHGTEVMMRKAIRFIQVYLDSLWNMKTHCRTCKQAGTATEVQLVCSGCRVACYCSVDHQRMTWKKEAESGMRFGHEVLCPLMKAYRKWRCAFSNDNGDNERVSRLRRRFERECLYCLSDGMGLKDKCFQK